MILLQATAVLHQNLMIGIILIAVGYLGMLLQRHRLATVFSLLIWLQGAGLMLAAFAEYQGSRAQTVFFLFVLFLVVLPAAALAVLSLRRKSPDTDTPAETKSPVERGAGSGG
ncbi:MAG: hypothetical protein CME32_27540 [Gimesia sp.]|nr:hypothetical protein [Gimesia sp.]